MVDVTKEPIKAAKQTPKAILIKGGLGLMGLYGSRVLLSRFVGDNTPVSAAIKGISGVGLAGVSPPVAVGVLIDAADDVMNILRGMTGGGAGGGAGGGGGQGVF